MDLSDVMFIATANTIGTIPRPLLDRMELIEVNGYITEEKIEIAKRHLVPRVKAGCGLKDDKSIKLNKTQATIKKGKSLTLKATIAPKNATNKKVTWKTSNKKVATVSSKGVVKGIKKGKATITCTTKSGKKKATCTVKVN